MAAIRSAISFFWRLWLELMSERSLSNSSWSACAKQLDLRHQLLAAANSTRQVTGAGTQQHYGDEAMLA